MAAIQQHASQLIEPVQPDEDAADDALFNERMAELRRGVIDGTNALPPEPEC
jgi:hypothetical protein